VSYASHVGLPDTSPWPGCGNPLIDLWYDTRSEAAEAVLEIEYRAPEEIEQLGMPEPEYEDIPEGWIERYPGAWERRESFFAGCGDPTCAACRWPHID
jgi:hypothetical protein